MEGWRLYPDGSALSAEVAVKINIRPRRKNAPRPAEKSCPQFLQWLRGRECFFVDQGDCEGKIEAMHLDFAGGKGVSTKVADRFAIPACARHHHLQHWKGWITFLRLVGLTKERLLDAAGDYWHLWPGRIAHERKLEERNG